MNEEKSVLLCMDCGHPADAHANGHYPLIEGTEDEWAIGRCQASIIITTRYAPATSTSISYPCRCYSGRVSGLKSREL
jgi:hypothetical protein